MSARPFRIASVDDIRSDFPCFERVHPAGPVAWFDGPGGTQVPARVAEAMTDYLLHHNANTHWAYASSAETDAMLAEARQALADFLCCDPAEVVFGANMTSLTYHLSRAVGRALQPGDEVIVTRLDHQANVAPWHDMARDVGAVVREIPFDVTTGQLRLDRFFDALGERTRVVALGAASNALGTVTDVAPLISAARAVGAFTFVDAVHFAPHERVDVRALGCHALGCSPYKFYGPHLGCLYIDAHPLARLDIPRLPCAGDAGGERLETGTLSHEAIVGAAAAVDWLASLARRGDGGVGGAGFGAGAVGEGVGAGAGAGDRRERLDAAMAELHARADALLSRLWTGLEAIDGVRLYGPRPGERRTSTLAFTLTGRSSEEVTRQLDLQHGVFTSHGDFYASTVIEDLGVGADGLVRAGTAVYTTEAEVDRLVRGVQELADGA